MIFKELDPFTGSDKFSVAGRRAEEQMAHYLKRFFGANPEIDVLNYLRVELGGEVAQVDHLVLHPFGLVIVESKSVAGSVQIKDDGQWIRWFNKQPQGMRSPVTQATMQAMLLRELLARTAKQKGFFDIDVLVAISDSGTIQRPSSGVLPEVCKADQVPERILRRVDQRRSGGAPILTADHRRAIGEFLGTIHRPLTAQRQTGASYVRDEPSAAAGPSSVLVEAGKSELRATSALPGRPASTAAALIWIYNTASSATTFTARLAKRTPPSSSHAPHVALKGGYASKGRTSSQNAAPATPQLRSTATPR